MKKIGLIILMWVLACVMALPAYARDTEERGSRKHYLTERTYRRLNDIHLLIEENKPDKAIQSLDSLAPAVKRNLYETALIHQTYGYAYVLLEDNRKAIESFKAALDLNALPDDPARQTRYALAQLYMSTERYREGIKVLEQWFTEMTNPPPESDVLAANGYIQLQQLHKAIAHLQRAIAQSTTPKEVWYQMLLALYSELSEDNKAAQLLESMIVRFPDNPIYWRQLSHIYMALHEDEKALAVLELAEMKGLLQEKDMIHLSSYYLHLDLPYKAGGLLERGLKEGSVSTMLENFEILSNAWVQAKEIDRAVVALRGGAKLAQDGSLDLRIGALLVELGRFEEAIEALETGLLKGGIEDEGRAYLLLGVASNEAGNPGRAVASFKNAKTYPGTRRSATQWLTYLRSEKEFE